MKSVTLRSLSTRDSSGYHQQMAEMLRSALARSEDIAQLQSGVEQSFAPYALEQLVTEIELREDWRISKEDCVLLTLNTVNLDSSCQKVSFDKTVRQLLHVIIRFLPPPTTRDLNSSELHLGSIMSAKVCPQTIVIDVDKSGRKVVSVPGTLPEPEEWTKSMCKEVRIVEACLYGESVNVGLVMSTCLRFSRKILAQDIAKIRSFIDKSDFKIDHRFPLMSPIRKSPSMPFLPLKQPSHRSVIKSTVVHFDWKQKMLEALLDLNKEALKAVSGFLTQYRARQAGKTISCDVAKYAKNGRAKMYEMYGAVSPYSPLPEQKDTCEVPDVPLRLLRDVKSDYFPVNTTLKLRVKTIHCILTLQKAIRKHKKDKLSKKAAKIQRWFRAILREKRRKSEIITRFRRQFYSIYVKNRLKKVIFKRRERNWKGKLRAISDYKQLNAFIVTIQRHFRGFLVRHRRSWPVKSREMERRRQKEVLGKVYKQAFWGQTEALEGEILGNAVNLMEQLTRLKQGKRPKALKREKDLIAYIKALESAGVRERKQRLGAVAEVRIRIMQ